MTGHGLPGEDELTRRAAAVAAEVRRRLYAHRRERGSGERPDEPADLKSTHEIDRFAAAAARAAFADRHCNVVIEGEAMPADADAAFSIYVDPVDGSLNWERGVGDPAFVLSAAAGPRAACLDELVFTYVAGLRSGDVYRTAAGDAWHRCAFTGIDRRLATSAPVRLSEATGYLRAGYGGARRQLVRTLPLYLDARDLRAMDNAAIEFGDIARNAAHFMVEARSLSDGFNLLAWPLVRAAGGVLVDLDGADLADQPFEPTAAVDYVLAGNRELAQAVVERLARFGSEGRDELQALVDRLV